MASRGNDHHRSTTSGKGKSKGKKQVSSNVGSATFSPHTSGPNVSAPSCPPSFLPPLGSLPHLGYNPPSSAPYYSSTSQQNTQAMPSYRNANQFMPAPRPGIPPSSYHVVPSSSCPIIPSSSPLTMPSPVFPHMASTSIPSYRISQPSNYSSLPSSESTPSSTPSVSRPHVGSNSRPTSPSTDTDATTHPPSQFSVEIQFAPNGGQLDEFRRLIIAPDGGGFHPSNEATKAVVKSFCSFYCGPWKSWTQVPLNIRERMYAEFKTKCAWEVKHEAQVRNNFFRKCAERMTDLLRTARQCGERPFWINEESWTELIEYWASPEFQKRSAQGKAARASNRGGSLHTGGSISMGAHRRRLEKIKGGPVSQAEIFEETHMKKLKDGTKTTWIEQRAEITYNNFKQYMEEFMHNQPKDDEGNPIQPSEEEVKDMWLKAAGGMRKGRVYGLGTECSVSIGTSRFSGPSSSSQSSVNQDELEQLHRRIAELNELYMQEKAAREEDERRREEEERRRAEEMKKKDDEFKRVTSDVQSLKAQLLMLLSSGQLPNLPRSPPSSDNEQ